MSYAALSLCFLLAALVAGVLLPLLTGSRRPSLRALVAAGLALFALTAIFDNAMIAAQLFHYSPSHLLGFGIGLAPVEDFAYPLAAVLVLPALWEVLQGRAPRTSPGESRTRSHRSGRTR